MTRHVTLRLRIFALLTVLGAVTALAIGRPEPVALVVPFALASAAGLVRPSRPTLRVAVSASGERVLEGDEVEVEVRLSVAVDVLVEVSLALRPGAIAVEGDLPAAVLARPAQPVLLRTTVRLDTWGVHRLGTVRLRLVDGWGLFAYTTTVERPVVVRAYPRPEPLRSLVRPARTRAVVGVQTARAHGDGMEFADLRPWRPGDRMHSLNWRATARRQEPWVNDRHPDRSADVVLFLDSFEGSGFRREQVLGHAVRAAAALASGHHRARDRLGLIGFGSTLRWLAPGTGTANLYRLVDVLIDTEVASTETWRSVSVLPPRSIPSGALVLGLSPLTDERSVTALADVRARGFEVAVLQMSAGQAQDDDGDEGGEVAVLARRILALRQTVVRRRLEVVGVPVVTCPPGVPLEAAVREVEAWRRGARMVNG